MQWNKIELYKSEYAPDAIIFCGQLLGFQKEAIATASAAEQFLKDQGVSTSS